MEELKILCYGDSNTWGYIPGDKGRYDDSTRWPGVLQHELGERYRVFEEGHCGRTTVFDDPTDPTRNGRKTLPDIIRKYPPLNLIILMLGTNDLKSHYSASTLDSCKGLESLIEIIRTAYALSDHKIPEILIICPPPFADMSTSPFKDKYTGGEVKSYQLAETIKSYFKSSEFHIFAAGEYVSSSPADGIHLEAKEQIKLGKAISTKISSILQ